MAIFMGSAAMEQQRWRESNREGQHCSRGNRYVEFRIYDPTQEDFVGAVWVREDIAETVYDFTVVYV